MVRARVIGLMVATLLAALVGMVPLGAANGSGRLPGGDPRGVALLARVAKRYLTVRGVRVDAGALGVILISLKAGVVQSQEWRTSSPSGDEYSYLWRVNRPVYEYVPSLHCWQRNPPGSSAMTSLVGKSFVGSELERVEAPIRVPGGWKLRATLADTDGQVVEYRITTSYLFRQVTTEAGNHKRLVEHIHELAKPPRIPTTRPLCRGLLTR